MRLMVFDMRISLLRGGFADNKKLAGHARLAVLTPGGNLITTREGRRRDRTVQPGRSGRVLTDRSAPGPVLSMRLSPHVTGRPSRVALRIRRGSRRRRGGW